ncbi:MAG: inositol monophosphatase/fructose,6-bisphosphatase family protein [Actinomycetia bacterium]|nr:inositol monophosphatase/fructose,6-bisphosphatase family protein [Actinomycetes bacterium]
MNTTSPDALLELFVDVAAAVRRVVSAIRVSELRARTDRLGQYALDLVADAEACRILEAAGVRIVSEESGVHEHLGAAITVVLDPVDGSTNCSRNIPYWATSICALDADGALAGLVVNQATGVCVTARRDGGAFRDGTRLHASSTTRLEESMIYLTGAPPRLLPWKQFRALGSAALGLCEIASGSLDGLLDAGGFHAPWDYLAGYLACVEAGAVVCDAQGRDLVTDDIDARRQLVAAGTPELADAIRGALA